MYFLNGDRIYIKPQNGDETLDNQIADCFGQLQKNNRTKKLFKLNFFVNSCSDADYAELQEKITAKVTTLFNEELILSFIAQPPLTSKIVIEAFYFEPSDWQVQTILEENSTAKLFSRGATKILIGTVKSDTHETCKIDAENGFNAISLLLKKTQFPVNSILRQWNYISGIIGFDGEGQRYQEFNNVRSGFYGSAFGEKGYPAATGIGMDRGGVVIEFIAVKSDEVFTKPVDNPEQIAAHIYSKEVLVGQKNIKETTPKFERARFMELSGRKLIFISGTAAITGEKTVATGNPEGQTKVTIQNIRRLYSKEVLNGISKERLRPKYGHARVYVKRREDFEIIKKTVEHFYGNLPVVYILADICRDDLLVEIEGKVVLEGM